MKEMLKTSLYIFKTRNHPKTKEQIIAWLIEQEIENYTINEDLTVDVTGHVYLHNIGFDYLPVSFNRVTGNFNCLGNNIRSLKGCPKEVGGHFDCSHNQLDSLEFGPQSVGKSYSCSYNKIKSLKYCTKKFLEDFDCSNNQLTSLEFCPEYSNYNFNCSDNKIISLKGCPEIIKGYFDCSNNKLKNLSLGPKVIHGQYICSNNKIKSVQICPEKVLGSFFIDGNPLKSLEGFKTQIGAHFIFFNKSGKYLKILDKFLDKNNKIEIPYSALKSLLLNEKIMNDLPVKYNQTKTKFNKI